MARKSLASNEEALSILEECVRLKYRDKDTQEKLKAEFGYEWSLQSIRRSRIKITGVKKTPGKKITTTTNNAPLSVPPPGLSEKEKIDWFREDFKKSHLFFALKKQLYVEEIAIYMEEWGRICCDFEDIVVSEFFQIDDFLKHRILIARQLVSMKSVQNEIVASTEWLEFNPVVEEEAREKKQERVMRIQTLGDQRSSLGKSEARYDKLCTERDKIENKLNVTRKNRLEQLAGGKDTFMNLVAKLQHLDSVREEQGKYAELTRLAGEDAKDTFRKEVEFPDGSFDTIITDSESIKGDEE